MAGCVEGVISVLAGSSSGTLCVGSINRRTSAVAAAGIGRNQHAFRLRIAAIAHDREGRRVRRITGAWQEWQAQQEALYPRSPGMCLDCDSEPLGLAVLKHTKKAESFGLLSEYAAGKLNLSPDDGTVIYDQLLSRDSTLMIVDNFR